MFNSDYSQFLFLFLLLAITALLVGLVFIILRLKTARYDSQKQLQNLEAALLKLDERQDKLNSSLFEFINSSSSNIGEVKSSTATLKDQSSRLATSINEAKETLGNLKISSQHSKDRQDKILKLMDDMSHVFAGTKSKGKAAENLLGSMLEDLPVGKQHRNFKIGGKNVEFAFKLRDNKFLPVDSKFISTDILTKLDQEDSSYAQDSLRLSLEKEAVKRAREITKYIDPSQTTNFVIAAVPDAAEGYISAKVKYDLFEQKVLIVGYSRVLNYLLLIDELTPIDQDYDVSKLIDTFKNIERISNDMLKEIENSLIRGSTMITNSIQKIQGLASGIKNQSSNYKQHSAKEHQEQSEAKIYSLTDDFQ